MTADEHDVYAEALRHMLDADRLMEAVGDTLFRAQLATPIALVMHRLEMQADEVFERSIDRNTAPHALGDAKLRTRI